MGVFGLHLPKKVNKTIGNVEHGAANFIGNAVVKPAVQFGVNVSSGIYNKGVAPVFNLPHQNLQQGAINPTVNRLRGFSGAIGGTAQTIGSGLVTGLNIAAPGTSKLLEGGAARLLPSAAPKIIKVAAPRILAGTVTGTGVGAVGNAGSYVASTPHPTVAGARTAAYQGAKFGALTGGVLSSAPFALKGGKVVVHTAQERAVPLNEVGAVGKNVPDNAPKPIKIAKSLTPKELAAGKALGMTKKDIIAAKQDNGLETAFKTRASKMSPEDLANLKPNEQMATAQLTGRGQPKIAPAAVNRARNPFKADIAPVGAGEYAKARLVPQTVGKPIHFVADRLDHALSTLKKANPDEYSNFWKHVEKAPKNASPELQQAVKLWRNAANRVHGNAVALGQNTNYLKNYARHPWELKGVTEDQIASGGPGVLGSSSINRKHMTIAQGKKAGLKLGSDPHAEAMAYLRGGASALERISAKKALDAADIENLNKPHTLDLGHGHTVQLSEQGFKEAQGLAFHKPASNVVVKGLRTANVGLKSSLLSFSQFHPFNIAVLRAAPTLAFKGHPGEAITGVARTFRPLLPGGKDFSEKILNKALDDGMVDKAAKLGMPYGEAGYNTAGSYLKGGVGHKLVFERQMPMMHDQMVRSVVKDLEKKGIALESNEARKVGTVANATMGFINKEALNISPKVRQGMTDLLLAGQFTPSKGIVVGKSFTGGMAGSYARADVATNVAGALAITSGIGYLMGQKSDNARDMLLRALINPAAPTNMKDANGNTQELRIPMTNTAEIAHILGIKLVRQKDGHLGVSWNAHNVPETASEWMRARLSPLASTAVKVKTNTSFANKPLYDPSAPAGTKAIQGATTIGSGFLPIGAQGLAYSNAVKNHVPGSVKTILDANTPGANPLLKSVTSSVGFTPRTDVTVGKARESNIYFGSKDQVKSELKTNQERDAFDLYTGSKKNPVTGKYDTKPTVWDTITKSTALLQNPGTIDALIKMNKNIAAQGGKVDPLWMQSKDKITAYLQYQSNPDPFSNQKTAWYNNNKSWYGPLATERSKFFGALPKGDPNKPAQPVEYPAPSSQVQALKDQYYKLDDPKQKFAFIKANPGLQGQFDKEFQYKNDLLKARGLSPYKDYPKAQPNLQKFIDQYTAADKGTRKGLRSANPQMYQNMSAYFDSVDLYNIGKDASVNQLQGQPDYTSKELKAVSGLSRDIYQNADGTYGVVPAGWMQGLSNSSSGSGFKRGGSRFKKSVGSAGRVRVSKGRLTKGHKVKIAKVKVTSYKSKV